MAKKKSSRAKSAPKRTTVLIADDHPIIRFGLRAALDESDTELVAEAENGADALEKILLHKPDVAVLDMMMPFKTAMDILSEIADLDSKTKIIVLTGSNSVESLENAIRKGASGYVSKDNCLADVGNAIRAVMCGQTYVSPLLSGNLLRTRLANKKPKPELLPQLSRAENQVLKLLGENKTNDAIAEALNISPKTVKNHRAHICAKLGLAGANALLSFALEHKESL
ncbi:MAG: response regulator transcription factor [Nitrospinae bacterium]|nr:response regulator transcription factor [Nitrospinota bacterium]